MSATDKKANRLRHLVSLSMTKTADALIEPKLVLAWLMSALGAPAYLSAALVPIREGGALLPQPLIARWAKRTKYRKSWWSLGALIQGLAALLIASLAWSFEGALAGWCVLVGLTIFSFGRAIASTTYKDALARTVDEGDRGSVTGLAGSIAATGGLAFGAAMAFGIFGEVSQPVVIAVIAVAGMLFLAAAGNFLGLDEEQTDDTSEDAKNLSDYLKPLRKDENFRRFVIARSLLTATALAPPFIVTTATMAEENSLTTLGPLVIASGLAAILSAAVWGRLSDWSSRWTLAIGGALAAGVYAVAAGLVVANEGQMSTLLAAAVLFIAQVGYQGVRSGRSIYLTDMASDEERLHYTALSNTIIGAVLVLGLGLGVFAHAFGSAAVLAVCAVLSVLGSVQAARLVEVSEGNK